MAKYDAETIPCCPKCDSTNVTKVCKKCAVLYCVHFASTTDYRYCGNCISDFHIRETIMEKVVEHEKADGTVTFSRKYQAKHMTLTGTDWLFAAALIVDMTDSEIEESIEYHRANIGLMLQERESRKLERYQKLSNIKIANIKHETQLEREKREEKEAAKLAKANGKKTRVKEKEVTGDQLLNMLQQLAKSGLSVEQITGMLGGKK